MEIRIFTIGVFLLLTVSLTWGQVPKRIQIPGAIPIGSVGIDRPLPLRRLQQQQPQQYQAAPIPQQRLRRPIPNAIPAPLPQIRPVVEEPEDLPTSSLNLNEEAARLASIPLPSPPRQHLIEDDDDDEPQQRQYVAPVQFRPERPPIQIAQPVRPPPQPVRQVQQVRQVVRQQQAPQPVRRPQPQYADDENVPRNRDRTRKPEVKILRKYREDNPDGSITWGFENDDGTFKEETIGIDCITRGKYGYIDPDGNRREYSYETGLKCDEPEPDEDELVQQPPPGKNFKRPQQQIQPIRLQ